MKKLLGFLCAVTLVFGMVGNASALQLLTNGDFETGDFTGWDAPGNVQIIDFDDTTLSGAIADFVAAAQGMDDYFALFGAGSNSEEASLSQDFTLSNISEVTISFNWAFDYWDWSPQQNDTFVSLFTIEGISVIDVTLLDLQSSFPGGITSGYFEQTYDLTSYGFTDADICFTLTEANTNWTNSLAGIDNVSVTGAPVPEPATILLMGTGLLGIVAFGRKRLNKKA
jgi:hypothetical protein